MRKRIVRGQETTNEQLKKPLPSARRLGEQDFACRETPGREARYLLLAFY